jgi:preprotein translocase subunit YajC
MHQAKPESSDPVDFAAQCAKPAGPWHNRRSFGAKFPMRGARASQNPAHSGVPMDFFVASAQAQTAAGGAAAAAQQPGVSVFNFGFIALMFLAMYFIVIRPQAKFRKEQRAMIAALNKGDEVLTNGGLLGRIDELGEQTVALEIAPGVIVKLRRDAVSAVLPKGTIKAS